MLRYGSDEGHVDSEMVLIIVAVQKYKLHYRRGKRMLFCDF